MIGLINPGLLSIGDTSGAGRPWRFAAIPRFAPERFGVLRHQDIARSKTCAKGLAQLEEEGAIQVLRAIAPSRREPLAAAVGELPFEVVVARLKEAYGVDASVERLPVTLARGIAGDPSVVAGMMLPMRGTLRGHDRDGQVVVLFASSWELESSANHNPDAQFLEGPSS